jgi:hypothetical protein
MIPFLMQQVDAETLLYIAFTVFRPKPSRVLRKLLGQGRDPLGYVIGSLSRAVIVLRSCTYWSRLYDALIASSSQRAV